MVEIVDNKLSESDQLVILEEKTNIPGDLGWTQLDMRVSDGESEDNRLFISLVDDKLEPTGHYRPFDLNLEELSKTIHFLQECYDIMSGRIVT